MNVVRYEPWGLLGRLNRELDAFLQNRPLGTPDDTESNVVTSNWMPSVDIKEDDKQFTMVADIPGVDPKDIEITMENGVLTLKGEREHEVKEEHEAYRRVERTHGTFYRRFSLPETADAEHITAKGENGVLTVTIPKREKAQPKRIEVVA